ncbi:type ISP restriction/modification enzyme [Fervidobacterium thailandense]|uniref:Uncharacterized protein n=1 Tax=Fervidobacterium thailandense TaxID=1008305 RepID=A0A1E3G4Z4_9BACT|nr:type ISP restriction/modification enzyme [Fervidobacterium thailandense]ODN31314.1 hypothetical protein A4H02_00660 [Fervidobacterium thailandense]
MSALTGERLHDKKLELLKRFNSYTPQEKGRLFEKLTYKYLKEINPYYSSTFVNIWRWSDYPNRGRRTDFGVDIVAEDKYGKRWAIQCKLHKEKLNKGDLESFFAALGTDEFQAGMIVTSSEISEGLEKFIGSFEKQIITITLDEILEDLDIETLDLEDETTYKKTEKKRLRKYQIEAIESAKEYFKRYNRGKLIMPPGSGKTFVALKLTEEIVGKGGLVLFLCPSIALLDQTMREWEKEADLPIRAFAVVSDKTVGRTSADTLDRLTSLHYPPTTSADELLNYLQKTSSDELTVIFSTYQSIEVVSEAQKKGLKDFDLIICDEAHRTTGITKVENGEKKISYFQMVHSDEYVKGLKRLYMTATPRVFDISSREIAEEFELEYYSMDDPEVYGETIYEYTFRKAVDEGYLSDYKVIVFSVDRREAVRHFYDYLREDNTDDSAERLSEDLTFKLFGVWKVIQEGVLNTDDEREDLRISKAILFTSNIKTSRMIAEQFKEITEQYLKQNPGEFMIRNVHINHIDGEMRATERRKLLNWLAEGTPENVHVLTNAKVLTEGIDVPSLDAVIFTQPKQSVVEIIQAIGRVMRKASGKRYGYIIIPVLIDPEKSESEQIEKTDYKTIWQIVNALRAIDETFDAKFRIVIKEASKVIESKTPKVETDERDEIVVFNIPSDLKRAILGRMAKSLGLTKKYLEDWGKEVAKVAERISRYIEEGLKIDPTLKNMLDELWMILKEFVNDKVSYEDTVSMVVQHILTVPIFEALFSEYDFLKDNPVAKALSKITEYLKAYLERETKELAQFYTSVEIRSKGIDKESERQEFLRTLYDSFFRIAFNKVAEQLGIVYTPVEVVDFIIKSVDYLLKTKFGKSLADDGVVILEPFAGTGTFITRLFSYLPPEAVKEKVARSEIWANEILLLPYYVSKANIESSYFDKTKEYVHFKNILLVDSFEMMEKIYEEKSYPTGGLFPEEYSMLVNAEKNAKINVIISNPPWFALQETEHRNIKRPDYKNLKRIIREKYSKKSKAQLRNALYDSYILAMRMALDRIGERGVVGFVTNNGWIDGNAMDGLRKGLEEELSEIYVINLRGNARLKGEAWKREGGKIFGQGSRAGVCIVFFVKDQKNRGEKAKIYYYDIGDYLSREEKLEKLRKLEHIGNLVDKLIEIVPNEFGDWINQRRLEFYKFIPLASKDDQNTSRGIFEVYSGGLKSNRDPWVYNFSRIKLEKNMRRMIEEFNRHVFLVAEKQVNYDNMNVFLENDAAKIKWDGTLKTRLFSGKTYDFETAGTVYVGVYRPFVKMFCYFSNVFNNSVYQLPKIFHSPTEKNVVLITSGKGPVFDVFIVDTLFDYQMIFNGRGFPLWVRSGFEKNRDNLFDFNARKINISQKEMSSFKQLYGKELTEEDVFYYTFGILNSPDYVSKYFNELRKDIAHIPFVKGRDLFELFKEVGKAIADLLLNYETIDPYPVNIEIKSDPDDEKTYYVTEMKYDEENGTFQINENILISGIPKEAFNYKVNGKHPFRWVAEYYRYKIDPETMIEWDPNDWLRENNNPRYFVELIPRLVTVSLRVQELRNQLKGKLIIDSSCM